MPRHIQIVQWPNYKLNLFANSNRDRVIRVFEDFEGLEFNVSKIKLLDVLDFVPQPLKVLKMYIRLE